MMTKRHQPISAIDWLPIADGLRDGSQMLLYRKRPEASRATGTYWIGSFCDDVWIEDTECRQIHPTHCAVLVPPRIETGRATATREGRPVH